MIGESDVGWKVSNRFFLDSKIKESLGLSMMIRWLVDLQNAYHLNILNGSWNKGNQWLLEKTDLINYLQKLKSIHRNEVNKVLLKGTLCICCLYTHCIFVYHFWSIQTWPVKASGKYTEKTWGEAFTSFYQMNRSKLLSSWSEYCSVYVRCMEL